MASSKRSFFKRCLALAAVVALAPEIAFAAKLPVQPKLDLDLDEMFRLFMVIKESRVNESDQLFILTDRLGVEAMRKMLSEQMVEYYEKQHAGDLNGY